LSAVRLGSATRCQVEETCFEVFIVDKCVFVELGVENEEKECDTREKGVQRLFEGRKLLFKLENYIEFCWRKGQGSEDL